MSENLEFLDSLIEQDINFQKTYKNNLFKCVKIGIPMNDTSLFYENLSIDILANMAMEDDENIVRPSSVNLNLKNDTWKPPKHRRTASEDIRKLSIEQRNERRRAQSRTASRNYRQRKKTDKVKIQSKVVDLQKELTLIQFRLDKTLKVCDFLKNTISNK
ncbi:hypothetical protein A3Q56_03960 [Intoshia linei]|uniref:BZIP domain-containing protein n=1 Tax=Intoshia linei TaxID=1819745 RepID=A0A177B1Z4_9BILA|nr:hypothetical protein A3Q56_03960 [Intoshia linei]